MDNNQPQINITTIQKNIKGFCDEDFGVPEFEEWVYNTPALEAVLGSSLYIEAISTDFSKKTSVALIKKALREWLIAERNIHFIEYISTIQSSYKEREVPPV